VLAAAAEPVTQFLQVSIPQFGCPFFDKLSQTLQFLRVPARFQPLAEGLKKFGSFASHQLRHRTERTAVQRTGAVGLQRQQVRGAAVPFVFGKAIFRKLGIAFNHQAIPVHLGDDGGGCDRQRERIPVDHRDLRKTALRPAISVDQNLLWFHPELIQSQAHRL